MIKKDNMIRKNILNLFCGSLLFVGTPLAVTIPQVAFAQEVVVSVNIAPPELPVYVQPIPPGDDYLWVPGYWSWSDDDQSYFWVPGTWALAPEPGFLWTPGYWGWGDSGYFWHQGYWGRHIGYYGGINYGFGYGGSGYYGGRWEGGHFRYNQAYTNVVGFGGHNVYNVTNINIVNNTHVSFNGGRGGIQYRPNAQEMQFSHEQHLSPTQEQINHVQMARSDRSFYANENHGHPAIGAVPQAGHFDVHANVNIHNDVHNDIHNNDVHINEFHNDAHPQENHPIENKPVYNQQVRPQEQYHAPVVQQQPHQEIHEAPHPVQQQQGPRPVPHPQEQRHEEERPR